MALFDIIEDVSKKQVERTDTGDSRIMGVMLGRVVSNYDKNMPGKVSVILLSREQSGEGESDADQSRLLWARVAMLTGGSSWGHYFIPEVGDLVLMTFEQGNIKRPYIIGCIPKVNDKIITKSVNEKNQYKKIVTRYGNSVTFEDVAVGEGENEGDKDKITVETSNQSHKIILDNEKKQIKISDKEGKNSIVMDTDPEKGHIQITADKKMTIKVGDNITVTMNGSNGTVSVKSQKLSVQTDSSTSMESSGNATFKGTNVTLDGSSMVKVSSNGAVTVSGTPIKLG